MQETYKGDVLQKIAGVGLIVGGILTIVFNILAPRPDDGSDVASVMAALAKNPGLSKLAFLGIAVGIWFLVMGFAGIYRSITTGAASAWARQGFYGILVSAALFTTTLALQIGATFAAEKGASGIALGGPLVFAGNSLFALSITAYGLALVFVGLGMALSTVYPKWAGWAVIILGAATVIVSGIPAVFSTPTKSQDLIFAALALLSDLWTLVIGVWIIRREMKAM